MSSENAALRCSKSQSRMPVHRIVLAFVVVIAVAVAFAGLAAFASSAESRVGVIKLDPSKTLVEFRLGGCAPYHTWQISIQRWNHQS